MKKWTQPILWTTLQRTTFCNPWRKYLLSSLPKIELPSWKSPSHSTLSTWSKLSSSSSWWSWSWKLNRSFVQPSSGSPRFYATSKEKELHHTAAASSSSSSTHSRYMV
ncbi:hypothetical protein HMI55_003761 [Coelomomyces lativittatus]|nr:hypothetical protein HMI55_003761 [Coelomomyces lativittatus]